MHIEGGSPCEYPHTPVINALQYPNPNTQNITPNMALNPDSRNTRHSPQFFNTQVLGVANPQHTPIIRNPYANKSTPNNSKDNKHTPNSDSTPYKNTGSRKLYTSPFLEESQKPPKDSFILNSEFEPLLPLISSQHEAFTQHIKDLSEISLTATKVIEKKNDSFLLLTDKKKTPRSLRIKCTLSTSPEFSTDNEFIQLKEELDEAVATFINTGTNVMTKWAQRNIFLLKRERCTNILRKALQILDGLVHFHKEVIGTPSWPSVPTKNITLFLIKIYLSNEYLDISSLLAFLDLPLQQIKLICVQLLTHKHSEEAATDFFDSLLLSDINMNDNLQHDFIYESLIQFDQIIKITTIDVWSFYKNKSKQIHAGDSLKAKMATFETIDATSSTLQAIAKAAKNFDDSQNQNLETQLRLSNLEKSAKRQEQKTPSERENF
jgi:hypothetical protein